MTVYIVTGKLGSGKTLVSVGKIRDYLKAGRRVATNLDLCLDQMLSPRSRANVVRLPDKPRVCDLESLGSGYDGDDYDESKFGLLVLDELATWFNARTWNDKERGPVIDWFLHARKHGWNIMLLVQDVDSIDKQLKSGLCEHLVVCNNLSRLPIPIIGRIIGAKMPKMHMARVIFGESRAGHVVERWWYKGADLYTSYNTRQVFRDELLRVDDRLIDFRASYSLLPPALTRGRYADALAIRWRTMIPYLLLLTLIALPLLVFAKAQGCSPWALAKRDGLVRKRAFSDRELRARAALHVYRVRRFVT